MTGYTTNQIAITEYSGERRVEFLPVPNSDESRNRDTQIRTSPHLIATVEVGEDLTLRDIKHLNEEARRGREYLEQTLGDRLSDL